MISFGQPPTDPTFLTDMQRTKSTDPAGLRYRNLTGDSVEDEQSGDTETGHTTEPIGTLVIEAA